MNRLSKDTRVLILHMLVEGVAMQSIHRITGVSMNTIGKLLEDAGETCRKHHDRTVRNLPGRRHVQCDENWSWIYAKEKNAGHVVPWDRAGTVWTWIAIDTASRLVISYHMSQNRGVRSATKIMRDLKSRLDRAPDIAADQLPSYRVAKNKVFGRRGRLTQSKCEGITSHVERYNGKMRMGNKRYTRKTNAASKTFARHKALVHVQTVYTNFCWLHTTLKVSPAMEAGIDNQLRDVEWIIDLIDANTSKPKKPSLARSHFTTSGMVNVSDT